MNAVKIGLAALAIGGLSMGLTTGAHAQAKAASAPASETAAVVKPFSIKVGGLFFSNSDTKDAIGNNTVSVGLGYDFLKTKTESPIVLQAYLDYFASKSKDESITVGGITSTTKTKLDYAAGVGVAGRYVFMNKPTSSFTPYAFAGIGIYSLKIKGEGTVNDGESTDSFSDSKSKTGVGGKLGLGIEFKQGFLGEIEYNVLPEVNDNGAKAKLSGLGVRVGYRF